jgi:hypothetical protein
MSATIYELHARGHEIEIGPAWSEGRLTAASRVGSRRRTAANPRGMQGPAAERGARAAQKTGFCPDRNRYAHLGFAVSHCSAH